MLFRDNKISSENLDRLNFIGFDYNLNKNIFFEPISSFFDLNLFELNVFILIIEDLHYESGNGGSIERDSFIRKYALKNQKNYIGGSVIITETKYKVKNKLIKSIYDLSTSVIKRNITTIKKPKVILNANDFSLTDEDLILEIDKICRKSGSRYWTKFDRKKQNYNDLQPFLQNKYYDNSQKKWINYEFNNAIKLYVSKKMINILDEHLIVTGRLNHKKQFKPISFLMKYCKKNKDVNTIKFLNDVIDRHQLLKLIYRDKQQEINFN
jgi:hypothetical protein